MLINTKLASLFNETYTVSVCSLYYHKVSVQLQQSGLSIQHNFTICTFPTNIIVVPLSLSPSFSLSHTHTHSLSLSLCHFFFFCFVFVQGFTCHFILTFLFNSVKSSKKNSNYCLCDTTRIVPKHYNHDEET